MRILIVGAGSMGSVVGGKLFRAGFDVTLMDRRRDLVDSINRRGLTVRDPAGEFTIAIPAVASMADLSEVGLAIVLVDSNATLHVAAELPAVLSESGYILTLQNGIGNIEALTSELGRSRVVGGATYVSAVTLAPGHAHNTNVGDTVIGELDGGHSERIVQLSAILNRAGLPTQVSDNVIGHIWSKFALNCALNPLSAITGLRPGEVSRQPDMRLLLEEAIGEILSVISAKGIRLPESDPRRHIVEHARLRYNKPSMLQHLEQGLPTEIGSLNAALVAEAGRLGVAVPCNRAIAALVRGIEARNARDPNFDPTACEFLAQAELSLEAGPACATLSRGTP